MAETPFDVLAPRVLGAVFGVNPPTPGRSNGGPVETVTLTAVAPGVWVDVHMVTPSVGLAAALETGAVNLSGRVDADLGWEDVLVVADSQSRSAVCATVDDRRMFVFEGDDYTATVVVRGASAELPELTMVKAPMDAQRIDKAFLEVAGRRYHSTP